MDRQIFLSVIIPCYNEADNINNGKINQVYQFLLQQKYATELIIVDDGSNDKSRELIMKYLKGKKNCYLMKNPHQGKALTVISGMLRAKGELVLFTDLDGATPIDQVDKFLEFFVRGYDIVIGSREDKREGAPFIRAIMGPGFTLLRKLMLGMWDISDTQCGFKAFKNTAANNIFKRIKLYKQHGSIKGSQVTAGFDVEVLYLAKKMNYKIKDVPVKWNYVETRRVNPVTDSLSALKDLFRIKLNSLRGLYDQK